MVVFLAIIFGVAFFGIFFVGLGLRISILLRSVAGMGKAVDVETGELLRESSWGSGSVNGVAARSTLWVAAETVLKNSLFGPIPLT